MARIVPSNVVIRGYRFGEILNRGGFCNSYAAIASDGRKVFIKQYKSPSPAIPWYRAFIAYQGEIKRRIDNAAAKGVCCRLLDFFEAEFSGKQYFQVFEFVEGGHDLDAVLNRLRESREAFTWEQRLIFARVLLGGVHLLHQAKVVHADLKPKNIQLFEDSTITAGWRLMLIDFDGSLLADRTAPWCGDLSRGYIGSPNYMSPEHRSRGVPLPASDVFTCGLMLHELLTDGGNPYLSDDDDEYDRRWKAWDVPSATLIRPLSAPADTLKFTNALRWALCPDPKKRPSALDLRQILTGDSDAPALPRAPVPEKAPPVPAVGVELIHENGQRLGMHIATEIGKYVCRKFGGEADYLSPVQFAIVPQEGGMWLVRPNPAAVNCSFLNGVPMSDGAVLRDGDVLAVGKLKEAGTIFRMPLTVRLLHE